MELKIQRKNPGSAVKALGRGVKWNRALHLAWSHAGPYFSKAQWPWAFTYHLNLVYMK
jgi:hypothetical protein